VRRLARAAKNALRAFLLGALAVLVPLDVVAEQSALECVCAVEADSCCAVAVASCCAEDDSAPVLIPGCSCGKHSPDAPGSTQSSSWVPSSKGRSEETPRVWFLERIRFERPRGVSPEPETPPPRPR
jgi:hypothetical protein